MMLFNIIALCLFYFSLLLDSLFNQFGFLFLELKFFIISYFLIIFLLFQKLYLNCLKSINYSDAYTRTDSGEVANVAAQLILELGYTVGVFSDDILNDNLLNEIKLFHRTVMLVL